MIRIPDPPPDPAADARIKGLLGQLTTVEISRDCYACGDLTARHGQFATVRDGERVHRGKVVER